MQEMLDWMGKNWLTMVAIFWMAEKIVKLTPTKYDDILVDVIIGGIKAALGKTKPEDK